MSELFADQAADGGRARELLIDEWDEKINEDFPELQQEHVKGTFPNDRIHRSDKPHSGKQIIGRLFKGIPQHKEVMDRITGTRSSPSKLIHNSDQLKEQYPEKMLGEQIWRHRKLKDLGM